MLWFVSNVGNVSNDGRPAGLVIGAKSDRGRVSTHINSIGCQGGMKFKRAFILKSICHLQNTSKVQMGNIGAKSRTKSGCTLCWQIQEN